MVEHRDRRRCTVPGCANRMHVDIHHLVPFSRGGPHTPSNLACLCSAHHRLLHKGHLSIRGDAEHTLRFEFPNGRVTHVGREER